MRDDDDRDCDGMTAYRRRNADIDELLDMAEKLRKEPAAPAAIQSSEPDRLPARPSFSRYVGRLSDREQDEWIDRMRNRYGGEW